eukprot:105349-Rhodomonas_salina.1
MDHKTIDPQLTTYYQYYQMGCDNFEQRRGGEKKPTLQRINKEYHTIVSLLIKEEEAVLHEKCNTSSFKKLKKRREWQDAVEDYRYTFWNFRFAILAVSYRKIISKFCKSFENKKDFGVLDDDDILFASKESIIDRRDQVYERMFKTIFPSSSSKEAEKRRSRIKEEEE